MNVVVFTDLDETLFFARDQFDNPDSLEENDFIISEEGGENKFMDEKRRAILTWLKAGAAVIPVTEREICNYEDCHLNCFTDGAVIENGAIILSPDGQIDEQWYERVLERASYAERQLIRFYRCIESLRADATVRMRHHNGILVAIYVEPNSDSEEDARQTLAMVQSYLCKFPTETRNAIHMVREERTLIIMPKGVSKAYAVEYLLTTQKRFRDTATIGIGHSVSDLQYLSLCDMMVLPKDSYLQDRLVTGA